ncbi:MAG TPA: WecB/TagA/CpsF family glycosyltransferase [Patescibacteria group bacterium]|nr:WecB/TagA/CpsF family glycosyltransferase [Patescibacteria group bacterium]
MTKKTLPSIFILGVRFDLVGFSEAVDLACGWLREKETEQRYIVTPNPEFVVESQKDEAFLHILKGADLSIADGRGIQFAARFLGLSVPQRISGVDFMISLCQELTERNIPIFLLGAADGVAAKAAAVLQKKYPRLHVAGTFSGDSAPKGDIETVSMINNTNAKVVFAAFGAPKQEKWIARNLQKLPNVRLIVGVGGSFDYLSGKISRAPSFVRQIGLEWLWRLFREPKRFPRIFRAVIIFPLLVVRSKFS